MCLTNGGNAIREWGNSFLFMIHGMMGHPIGAMAHARDFMILRQR
jgi:hypothetical protein